MSHYIGAKENEVFVGNTDADGGRLEHLRELKTVRLGEQAFDLDGKPLPKTYALPLFIDRGELAAYDRIMTARTFGR